MKTTYRKQREKRDKAILKRYTDLMAQPGAMATAVEVAVMKQFGLHSRSTIHQALKRAKANLTTA